MQTFPDFRKVQLEQQTKVFDCERLFVVGISREEIWDLYLSAYDDPDIKQRHNCNCCKSYIRNVGNVIGIKDGQRVTMWDFEATGDWVNVPKILHKAVMNAEIVGVYSPVQSTFSQPKSLVDKGNGPIQFNHFYCSLPKEHMRSPSDVSHLNSAQQVFARGLEEFTMDTLNLVVDLMNQGSLLNGTTFLEGVKQFRNLKKAYDKAEEKEAFTWEYSIKPGARIRNTLIGTFIQDVNEGMDLTKACLKFNKAADPANYKKAVAPITQRQKEMAQKLVEELELVPAFDRRPATIEDIRANLILHMNVEDEGPVKLFDGVKTKKSRSKSELKGVQEITIDKFMSDILPEADAVEVLFENRHKSNLFTMFTADSKKSLFSYGNSFSFTTENNLAGKSELTELVRAAGGNIDAPFRFSFSWNHDGQNQSLMDLHVFMPGAVGKPGIHDYYPSGRRVGWNNRSDHLSKGNQDVDNTAAPGKKIPVENIVFPELSRMPNGKYECWVHNWSLRKPNTSGFHAELCVDGELHQFVYADATSNKEWIHVVDVIKKGNTFTVKPQLTSSTTAATHWNLDTNEFHTTELICLSPNHWDEPKGFKHYMFALKGCKAEKELRTFHTVDLVPELHDARKAIDYLGYNLEIKPEGKQLSGLCFNSTVTDHLTVRVKGSHQRLLKIKFN